MTGWNPDARSPWPAQDTLYRPARHYGHLIAWAVGGFAALALTLFERSLG